MDRSKIPEGKVMFGKSLFDDRDYIGVAIPLILKGHRMCYDDGYRSIIGFISNPKVLQLFE